ncbi:MAG: hypothetical protein SOZ34_08220 [Clostridia bacterium]|nr:hypothetical protein [Clostridia bacterium]
MNKKKFISEVLCLATAGKVAAGLSGCGSGGKINGEAIVGDTYGDIPEKFDTANEINGEKNGMNLLRYIRCDLLRIQSMFRTSLPILAVNYRSSIMNLLLPKKIDCAD